jgi:hypothetical protein
VEKIDVSLAHTQKRLLTGCKIWVVVVVNKNALSTGFHQFAVIFIVFEECFVSAEKVENGGVMAVHRAGNQVEGTVVLAQCGRENATAIADDGGTVWLQDFGLGICAQNGYECVVVNAHSEGHWSLVSWSLVTRVAPGQKHNTICLMANDQWRMTNGE